MLGDDDLAQMAGDFLAVRDDHAASVALRRGATTLDAQTVRVARLGGGGAETRGENSAERRGQILVSGAIDFDVQAGDRFNWGGQLYEIRFVRPNRRAAVMAEAILVV